MTGIQRVATIGFFDGCHLGHRHLIRQVTDEATRRDMESCLVTFDKHPRQVLQTDFRPNLLTTAAEKLHMLQNSGVNHIEVLSFTRQLASLTALQFMREILKKQLSVSVLIIGYDHHFGRRTLDTQNEGVEQYKEYGHETGIDVIQAQPLSLIDIVPSSSAIRRALLTSDIELANRLLGYKYFLEGEITGGFHIGRSIGFPTANLCIPDNKLLPPDGAYHISAVLADGSRHNGMMNIGIRPTLNNGPQRSVEVHLFDFNADIYAQTLRVEILHYLRPEKKFESVEALRHQLQIDEQQCRLF